MFFYVSKLFWLLFGPVNLLIWLALAAALLAFTRFSRPARWLGLIAALGLVALGFSPLSRLLVRPLEDRFPQVTALPDRIDGLIVLGGAIGLARGDVVLTSAAARMTKAVELARRYPQAKIVFTGGSANVVSAVTVTEADGARTLFEGLGLPRERLILEDRSRNTAENAVFTRALVHPKPGETWLLITSAWHMPRAMGSFRKAGFPVMAFPVDYLSSGTAMDFVRPYSRAPRGLDIADDTLKEWVGLVAYWAAGYTDAVFPGPRGAGTNGE